MPFGATAFKRSANGLSLLINYPRGSAPRVVDPGTLASLVGRVVTFLAHNLSLQN